jgi:type II secretory pathway component PulF
MNFFYEAVDQSGQTVLGKMDAADAAEVQQQLMLRGYRPQSIAPNPAVATNVPMAQQAVTLNGVTAMPVGAQTLGPMEQTLGPMPMSQTLGQAGQSVATAQQMPRNVGVTFSGSAARVAGKQTSSRATQAQTSGSSPTSPAASTLGGVKTKDLQLFFQQLASLIRSGMTVYAALDNLAGRTRNPNLARTVREMAERAHTGGRISDVMEHYPRIYSESLVGKVRAGELGGFLEIALAEIADDFQKNIALYRTAWVPKMLAVQALFTLAIAQPLFTALFASMDIKANMELYLRLLLLRNLPIALALYGLILFGGRWLQLPQNRRLRDSWSLRIRPFGPLQRQVALANFLRNLRRLYAAGVSPAAAWEGAMNTASNVVIREELTSAYTMMQQGASLPDAFAATGLFADPVEQLIATGHQSGEVVEMLDQAVNYYQARADEAAGKARFAMLRLGILAMLILGGATTCWLAYSYFHGIFKFVDDNFN